MATIIKDGLPYRVLSTLGMGEGTVKEILQRMGIDTIEDRIRDRIDRRDRRDRREDIDKTLYHLRVRGFATQHQVFDGKIGKKVFVHSITESGLIAVNKAVNKADNMR